MIIIFGECGRNARKAARVFFERFPNRNHPDHKVILRTMARMQETGQVLPNRKDCGGPLMIARTVENEEAILNVVEEDDTGSIGEIARPLGISSSTVYRVLKNNRQHLNHYIHVHYLQPEDYPARREFCKRCWNQILFRGFYFRMNQILAGKGVTTLIIGIFGQMKIQEQFFQGPFESDFQSNLWTGLLGDCMVPMSTESINLDNLILPL
jgi:hypothetical protein